MSNGKRFPLADAEALAVRLLEQLSPCCERIVIAGSIRRRKPDVGDIELLYIPKTAEVPDGLFDQRTISLAEASIDQLVKTGVLELRPSKTGIYSWGQKNKLAVHVESGIPVDLFATTVPNWWNSLVCRTGGKDSNLLITRTALSRGWSFESYGSGFRRFNNSDHHETTSERDVFEFLGLPYKEPEDRL
jgi:DNA polymerase/3'-5' exonuclease PolX